MKDIKYYEHFDWLCNSLSSSGALLVVNDKNGKPNPMTIGWGNIGFIWHLPILTVFVRKSRHTFGLIEKAKNFTVCVAYPGKLKKEIAICGTRSGRDIDKIAKCNFTVKKGLLENTSIINECGLFYECTIVHKNNLIPEELNPKIVRKYYKNGDYHRIYFGRIIHVYKK